MKKAENYALMVGTVGRHKNQKDAILAAEKAKIPLVICGKIRDQDYFDQEIKPLIDNINVRYLGELDFKEKLELYQKARVFLFPIKWEEPFGLVVIEALSCGTPVIAYPNGGPRDIIIDGKNGYLVKNPDEMAEKIAQIDKINRNECRIDAVNRFDQKVVGDLYYRVLAEK